MTDAPPESRRARINEDQRDSEGEDTWLTFATFGAVAYGLGCCLILPFAFGSWTAFTTAAVLGAPLWVVLLLGGVGLASILAYMGTRD